MDELLRQIAVTLKQQLYFVALQSTLTLPAICAQLEGGYGDYDRERYKEWYNKHVSPQHLTAEECYDFRCSMIHEGNAFAKDREPETYKRRILFVYPNPMIKIDNTRFYGMNPADNAVCIDVCDFCHDMMNSVKIWNDKVKDSPNYQKNYDKFFKLHMNGIPPYVVGMPVIG